VCPYCDCPISETIKKMKMDDLENYSSKSIDGLTGKISPVKEIAEPPVATSSDFEKEKAAILKDLGINLPVDDSKEDIENKTEENKETFLSREGKSENTETEINMGATVKFNKDMARTEIKRTEDTKRTPINTSGKELVSNKEGKKTSNKLRSKYAVLGITVAGILVIVYLIWSIAGSISTGINKTKKPNKTVNVIESDATNEEDLGFELHSTTLTITDDSVMVDYDSPQDTPWYKYRDKIKHVTFGKNVTKIGSHSFEGFDKITDINISNSVRVIGESAFCNCSSLTKITNMSKNIEEIGDYAFTACKKLNKIPGYTEEADFEPTVERIGVEAFKSCKSLEAFKVPMYTEVGTDAFFGHGNDFVLVCETSSDAYEYATAKGIPTKTDFDSTNISDPASDTQDEGNNNSSTNSEEKTKPTTPVNSETQNPPEPPTEVKKPTLAELTQQLGKAQTQEEKDKILTQIDQITNQ